MSGPPPYGAGPPAGYWYPPAPPGPPPPPPTTIVRASLVLAVMAGWTLLGAAIGFSNAPDQPASSSMITTVSTVTSVLMSLGLAAIYAVSAYHVRRGRNWARILPTVFAGLGLLSLPMLFLVNQVGAEFADAVTTWALIAAGIGTALSISFLVLVWHPRSNAFVRLAQGIR